MSPARVGCEPPAAADDLSARIRRGDQQALECAFSRLYTPLLTYLVNHFGDSDAAEDAIQSVFIELWERRATFDPPGGLRAYCFTAARHRMLNMRRTDERAARRSVRALTSMPEVPRPDADVTEAELEHRAAAAIAALPDRAREVFHLVREDGLTYAEAAHVLGVSINTVKTQLARVAAALRAAVGPFLTFLLVSRV